MSELGKSDCLLNDVLEEALASLEGWAVADERTKLHRTLVFVDFQSAFSFMTHVALTAEAMNHHPEWSNVWNRVDLTLTTHTAGGITFKDIALAQSIDEIARRYEQTCVIDGSGNCGGCQ